MKLVLLRIGSLSTTDLASTVTFIVSGLFHFHPILKPLTNPLFDYPCSEVYFEQPTFKFGEQRQNILSSKISISCFF
jgi:hypothetical protein